MGKASLLTDEFKKGMKYPIELRDNNGNQIYQEYINGFWYKREYDNKGNMIYCENSNGYWSKSEYDSNNNQIYFENSDGIWWKGEYDNNNNEIYFESSNGVIRDNRPKSIPSQEKKK